MNLCSCHPLNLSRTIHGARRIHIDERVTTCQNWNVYLLINKVFLVRLYYSISSADGCLASSQFGTI
jgi:hypothetical protein